MIKAAKMARKSAFPGREATYLTSARSRSQVWRVQRSGLLMRVMFPLCKVVLFDILCSFKFEENKTKR